MELGGTKRESQALFRELKLADESVRRNSKGVDRAQRTRPGSSRYSKSRSPLPRSCLLSLIFSLALVAKLATKSAAEPPWPGSSND